MILIVSPNKSEVISIKSCHFNYSIKKKLKIKTYNLSSSKQKEEEKK